MHSLVFDAGSFCESCIASISLHARVGAIVEAAENSGNQKIEIPDRKCKKKDCGTTVRLSTVSTTFCTIITFFLNLIPENITKKKRKPENTGEGCG